MELTKENYFYPENEKKYMGSTQFKNFVPALGGCEAASMAKIEQTREWLDFEAMKPQNKAFLVGSYLHAWNEGTTEEFKEAHPEIMKKRGSGMLKEFEDIDIITARLEKDPFFMQALEGKKEQIFTAELFGMPWKIAIDNINDIFESFTDLKGIKDIEERFWIKTRGGWGSFIEKYRYDIQLAIYAEIHRLSESKESYYHPHIAVTDKKTPFNNYEVISFEIEAEPVDIFVNRVLQEIAPYAERVRKVKYEGAEPERCGVCDFCKFTKRLKTVIHFTDLID